MSECETRLTLQKTGDTGRFLPIRGSKVIVLSFTCFFYIWGYFVPNLPARGRNLFKDGEGLRSRYRKARRYDNRRRIYEAVGPHKLEADGEAAPIRYPMEGPTLIDLRQR